MLISEDLGGKTILLTGCTGKLGREYLKAFASQEAKIIALDIAGSEPEKYIAENFPEYQEHIFAYEVDVSDEAQVQKAFADIRQRFETVDVVINNAAATGEHLMEVGDVFSAFDNYPTALWKKVIDINLTGTFLIIKHALSLMTDGSSIINVASIYGVVAPDHRIYDGLEFNSFAAYSASKAGVHGLTKWLATYLAERGIRVNTLIPGGVFNNQNPVFVKRYCNRTPLGRMATPADMLGMMIFLSSDSSRYCTGQKFIVDGGLTAW